MLQVQFNQLAKSSAQEKTNLIENNECCVWSLRNTKLNYKHQNELREEFYNAVYNASIKLN